MNELGDVPSRSWGRFTSSRCACPSDDCIFRTFQHNLSAPTGSLLEHVPTTSKARYARDFRAADAAIAAGRVATTSEERERFWNRWTRIRPATRNRPVPPGGPIPHQSPAITGFAQRVRTGYYGHGVKVSTPRVQTAVRAVGQTCELDIGNNPLYRAPERYLKPLELQFAGFRKEDPIPVPEIAVPVTVPNHVWSTRHHAAATHHDRTVGDLTLIAFYYLLRVGEYTSKRTNRVSRTVQFRLADIAFKRDNEILPRDAPIETLLTATAATLRLDNQKNGIRGSLIHRDAMRDADACPVKALVRRFVHLRDHGAHKHELLCTYWDELGNKLHVRDSDILQAVRATVVQLKLDKNGIIPERVGTHSLRAGGAMALKFAGADRDDIKKMGRWSSDTFLCISTTKSRNTRKAGPPPWHSHGATSTLKELSVRRKGARYRQQHRENDGSQWPPTFSAVASEPGLAQHRAQHRENEEATGASEIPVCTKQSGKYYSWHSA